MTQKANWTPFYIVGSLFVGGDTVITSHNDWQKLLNHYRRIYKNNAEQVVLQSVRQDLGLRGLSTFTLKHKKGNSITLEQWAQSQGMKLVSS